MRNFKRNKEKKKMRRKNKKTMSNVIQQKFF